MFNKESELLKVLQTENKNKYQVSSSTSNENHYNNWLLIIPS